MPPFPHIPRKSRKCKGFDDNGYVFRDGCDRAAEDCHFVHPEDGIDLWERGVAASRKRRQEFRDKEREYDRLGERERSSRYRSRSRSTSKSRSKKRRTSGSVDYSNYRQQWSDDEEYQKRRRTWGFGAGPSSPTITTQRSPPQRDNDDDESWKPSSPGIPSPLITGTSNWGGFNSLNSTPMHTPVSPNIQASSSSNRDKSRKPHLPIGPLPPPPPPTASGSGFVSGKFNVGVPSGSGGSKEQNQVLTSTPLTASSMTMIPPPSSTLSSSTGTPVTTTTSNPNSTTTTTTTQSWQDQALYIVQNQRLNQKKKASLIDTTTPKALGTPIFDNNTVIDSGLGLSLGSGLSANQGGGIGKVQNQIEDVNVFRAASSPSIPGLTVGQMQIQPQSQSQSQQQGTLSSNSGEKVQDQTQAGSGNVGSGSGSGNGLKKFELIPPVPELPSLLKDVGGSGGGGDKEEVGEETLDAKMEVWRERSRLIADIILQEEKSQKYKEDVDDLTRYSTSPWTLINDEEKQRVKNETDELSKKEDVIRQIIESNLENLLKNGMDKDGSIGSGWPQIPLEEEVEKENEKVRGGLQDLKESMGQVKNSLLELVKFYGDKKGKKKETKTKTKKKKGNDDDDDMEVDNDEVEKEEQESSEEEEREKKRSSVRDQELSELRKQLETLNEFWNSLQTIMEQEEDTIREELRIHVDELTAEKDSVLKKQSKRQKQLINSHAEEIKSSLSTLETKVVSTTSTSDNIDKELNERLAKVLTLSQERTQLLERQAQFFDDDNGEFVKIQKKLEESKARMDSHINERKTFELALEAYKRSSSPPFSSPPPPPPPASSQHQHQQQSPSASLLSSSPSSLTPTIPSTALSPMAGYILKSIEPIILETIRTRVKAEIEIFRENVQKMMDKQNEDVYGSAWEKLQMTLAVLDKVFSYITAIAPDAITSGIGTGAGVNGSGSGGAGGNGSTPLFPSSSGSGSGSGSPGLILQMHRPRVGQSPLRMVMGPPESEVADNTRNSISGSAKECKP